MYESGMSKGFTLVELAIVLVVVGLLVAGVLAGQDIIETARRVKLIREVNDYTLAIKTFQLKFNYLPGDMPNADSFFDVIGNGNGDEMISVVPDAGFGPAVSAEDTFAWNHMSKAGVVNSAYSGETNLIEPYYSENNIPKSTAYEGVFIWLSDGSTSADGPMIYAQDFTLVDPNSATNCLVIGGNNSQDAGGNYPTEAKLKVSSAYSIDTKLDDGKARQGSVRGVWDYSPVDTGGGCPTSDDGDINSTYTLNSTGLCVIAIKVN